MFFPLEISPGNSSKGRSACFISRTPKSGPQDHMVARAPHQGATPKHYAGCCPKNKNKGARGWGVEYTQQEQPTAKLKTYLPQSLTST